MRTIWVPHLKKKAVKDLQPNSDPSDPPLADGEKEKAVKLITDLEEQFGHPDVIFHSPKLRCVQTATPAFNRFKDQIPMICMDTLAQSENGDLDPQNPGADEKGLVYYGPRTYSPEWYELFMASFWKIMVEYHRNRHEYELMWVFTHRPLVAAARHYAQGLPFPTSTDDIDAMDKSLLPYCVFECGRGGLNWHEVPRRP